MESESPVSVLIDNAGGRACLQPADEIVEPARKDEEGQGPQCHRPSRLPVWARGMPFVGLHVACLAALLLPDLGISVVALTLCAASCFLRMFGITAGYHRYFAHRSYKTSRPMQFLLAWLGSSALQKGPLWWAGHHRRHHHYSDTPDDPHSPHTTSFWWSHVGWILSRDQDETPWEAIRDWSRFPELRWLDRNHWVPGLCLAVVCWLIGGWAGLLWGFVISTVLVYHATFAINSLSHLFGTRRYATNDDSRNNVWLALLTLGEGWHNNHHHYQSSANQGFFWWEIDISYSVIRLLARCGLVWAVRTPGAKVLALQANLPSTLSARRHGPAVRSEDDGVQVGVLAASEAERPGRGRAIEAAEPGAAGE